MDEAISPVKKRDLSFLEGIDDSLIDQGEIAKESKDHVATKTKKIKIKYCETSPDSCGPFIVSFPQGPPPPSVMHNREGGLHFKCLVRDSQGDGKNYDLKIVAETEKMLYTGQNFGFDSQITDVSKYVIGVFDKNRNVLKLIESPHIFKMRQSIKGYEEHVEQHALKDMDVLEQRRLLISSFGNKRSQQMVKNSITNTITERDATAIDEVAKHLLEQSQQPTSHGEEHRLIENIPPYDPNAKNLEDVYLIDQIISVEEMTFMKNNKNFYVKALQRPTHHSTSPEDAQPGGPDWISAFVSDRLHELETLKKGAAEMRVVSHMSKQHLYCQYLNYLIVFHKMPIFLPPVQHRQILPPIIYSKFIENFTVFKSDTKRYERAKPQQMKLINYICVLSLFAHNFQPVKLTLLAHDLGMTPTQLKPHFQHVGCNVVYNRTKAGDDHTEEESDAHYYTATLKGPPQPIKSHLHVRARGVLHSY